MKISLRSRYLILIILFSIIILGSIYYVYDHLGGFEEVKVYRLEGTQIAIIGKEYIGRQSGSAIEEIFMESRELVTQGNLKGDLAVVTFKNDTLDKNLLHQYIGVLLDTDMAEIPPGFEVREFSSNTRYAVFLSMHPLVRPSPRNIRKKFEKAASENNDKLRDFTLEIHYPDNSMAVEVLVK